MDENMESYPAELEEQQEMSDQQNQILQLEAQATNGAKWFYWIAGLSLVNSILWLTKSDWTFVIGLGATQLVDGIVTVIIEEAQLSESVKYIAFAIDLIIAGIYVLIGYFSCKKIKAVLIIGIIFYALDGLIFLLVMDVLSLAFHGLVLYYLFKGLKALNQLEKLEQAPQQIQTDLYQSSEEIDLDE